MTTVITYGTFDLFHTGHLNLLMRLKLFGQRLIVAVSTDEFNAAKGKCAIHSYQERAQIVSNIKYVDMVIPELSWDQKSRDIIDHEVDIFAMGDDWKGKFDHLSTMCSVIYLSRTEGISTSIIRESIARTKCTSNLINTQTHASNQGGTNDKNISIL